MRFLEKKIFLQESLIKKKLRIITTFPKEIFFAWEIPNKKKITYYHNVSSRNFFYWGISSVLKNN